ncbi:MAG: hypothetical protein ACODAD_13675 [Planctomycetota bacterium]
MLAAAEPEGLTQRGATSQHSSLGVHDRETNSGKSRIWSTEAERVVTMYDGPLCLRSGRTVMLSLLLCVSAVPRTTMYRASGMG